jgi:heme/copper-type cytochrome/quinol oxidase subunit 1
MPVRPFNVQEEVSMEVYKQKHPDGIMATYPPLTQPSAKGDQQSSMLFSGIMFTLIGAGIGAVLTYFALTNQRRGYEVIRDNNAV